MFEYLETFMTNMLDADSHFTVFPHNISEYESIEDLPEPLDDWDNLLDDVDEWLVYFPQACPRVRGSYTYTSVLLGFHKPCSQGYQSNSIMVLKNEVWSVEIIATVRKPMVLGWLLFSTSTMDKEVLHGKISLCISLIPIGLCWKMISVSAQGSIPPEQQVKTLHLYVNKLDAAQEKPQLMNLYTSKPELGHDFPLQIRMQLVPELDSILNTKGQMNAERLRVCQNTWLAKKQLSSKPGRLNSLITTICTCR